MSSCLTHEKKKKKEEERRRRRRERERERERRERERERERESYRRRLRSLCYVFRALINSFVFKLPLVFNKHSALY